MKTVYLLWSGTGLDQCLEEIFAYKIDAEACMRKFKELDQQSGRSYHYWIQEKAVRL